MIEVVPATNDHAAYIDAHVRPGDRAELWAACLHRPVAVMERGIFYSDEALTALLDGVPFCMWGIVPDSFIGNVGIPWLVGTTAMDKHAAAFLRRTKPLLSQMFQKYDKLQNYVDVRNTKAIEWLRWLGFKFAEPEPYGLLKMPFMRFWKESVHV